MTPDAVKTFDYWLGRGCTGIRLFTGSTLPDQATWSVDPKTYPFWEHAAAKNIPVCMQMKQEGSPLLRQIMDRFASKSSCRGEPHRKAVGFLSRAVMLWRARCSPCSNRKPRSWLIIAVRSPIRRERT